MTNLKYGINDRPKWRELILYSIQHCLAMFVANALISIIIYSSYGYNLVPAALMSAGFGTIVYLLITKFRSPVFLGSSAALISVMASCLAMGSTVHGNFIAVIIGLCAVGLIYAILSLIIHFTGTHWLHKLLPPVVIGPVVAIIGLSLASFATDWSMFNNAGVWNPWALIVAIVTMLIIAIVSHYVKGKLNTLPFLLGLIGGYLLALLFTGIGHWTGTESMKLVDLSIFQHMDWMPHFAIEYAADGIEANGFTWSQIPAILVTALPVALVAFCEHIGDHMNLSTVVERDLITDPGLSRTALGDGVATAIGGILGGMGNTTYGENVAVIGVTRVASVWAILGAAILAILLGWVAPLMTLVQSIPYCVYGGAALVLYGFIAVSGLRNLQKVDLTLSRNIIIVSVVLIAGIGGLFIKINDFQFTGVALAMILGILLNGILRPSKPKSE